MEAFSSKALLCLDSLESTFGKGLSALKSNVTKLVFSIRRPYDKYRSELLHRGALCGTSNSIQIITDEENRRYSPWFVDNIESPRETPIDYQHVYAQAVALGQEVTNRVKNQEEGWVYWLTTVDIDVMREHNGSKHPTPMTIQLHPQCLLGIQSILRNWTFLIFKQV